jgi:adenylate cyclase
VRECGGFVDKFIGDALLVVFGLFERDEARVLDGGASTALACARGLGERLDELNRARALRGEPALAVSVGIHTGDVVAGTIGWADRHEYTVIGDTVNIAARLQVLCKESADGILVSEQTFAAARAAGTVVADELPVRTVSLRGRAQTVGVYEVPFERSPNSLRA